MLIFVLIVLSHLYVRMFIFVILITIGSISLNAFMTKNTLLGFQMMLVFQLLVRQQYANLIV